MNDLIELSRDEMRNIKAGYMREGCEEPCSGNCPILNCCCEDENGECPFKKCVSSNLECYEQCSG